ncbi:MAG: DNA ligase [Chloroflexi bacterium]|nr:DNA ligase [Chloroflexota bacterium]
MSAPDEPLSAYRHKRDFARTPEPSGAREPSQALPIFVVQKHAASHLHYDFRLEVDGVLKSWAVPKGPSLAPHMRRLAVPTEDHPLAYANFEGVIPDGCYGAGTVMVWDTGTYESTTTQNRHPVSMTDALREGHVTFRLHGTKLRGEFALIHIHGARKDTWLLITMQDEDADPGHDPTLTQPNSVLTGRSLDEIIRASDG